MIRQFILPVALLLLLATGSDGQSNTFPASGDVGIGTLSPAAKLHVSGGRIKVENPTSTQSQFGGLWPLYIVGNWPNVGFNAYVDDNNWKYGAGSVNNYGGTIQFNPNNGDFTFHSSSAAGNTGANIHYNTLLTLKQNGTVGIGAPTPGNYKLNVAGLINASSIVVQSGFKNTPVFNRHYQLPALSSIEQYINTHHQLPGIPSAKTMTTEGVDLGKMNEALLHKIQELTLYLIQQQKSIAAIQSDIQQLKQRHHN
ncbi:hypothetical protein [Chitinophaga nivalis]|uniref:BZIP transcription factor n=1 Tax=Chitinophaga nivalis TaxID=2991709 RepID=A0ABT3IS64_9BACT|nr:hypothetical protein [Chitinophaga nivalis]MCW3463488.1 hypothetical protein [Chitinophaga nivalis]MCW3486822.1 hypothetical protein [Chitinophaga nivalis]